ncbi:MAG TPA: ATP-binding cassette domain-containing protein [Acidimicrobiales bacterium]
MSLERHLTSRDMVAAGLRLPASLDSEADAAVRADELMEMMGLGAFREKLVGELSTGTRRIVELACVLAQEPGVLLLDEPSGAGSARDRGHGPAPGAGAGAHRLLHHGGGARHAAADRRPATA